MRGPRSVPNGLCGTLLVVLVVTGCGERNGGSAGDTPGAEDTVPLAFLECDSGRVVSEASRSEMASWASGLTFQNADSSRGYISGVPPTGAGSIRVEAAGEARRRPRAVLRRGCIIGRIIATEPDTGLGLAAGTNYVWADSGSDGWRAVMIPQATSAALRSFRLAIHDHRTSTVPPPASASTRSPCLECELAGWCRWPTDTVRTAMR